MASSLFGKAARWAKSPQGQKVIADASRRAQQVAKDPATRARVNRLRTKVTSRDAGSGGSATSGGVNPPTGAPPPGRPGTSAPGDPR